MQALIEVNMKSITAVEAKNNFEQLLNETKTLHQAIQIVGSQTNAVLISEEEWEGIQETLYLLSIPGMGESIQEGLQTPIEECFEEVEW
jgi:prevent-host-death family protein